MSIRTSQNRRRFLTIVGSAAACAVFIGRPVQAVVSAPNNGTITAVTLIHGLPGKEEDLKEHLLSLAPPTRAEPGCITYDLYQSPDHKHEFMRFEVWRSLNDLEAHKQMPYLQASFDKRQKEGWTTQILTWTRVPE